MYKELGGISTPNDEDTLWRYLSFEQFVNILAIESLFFTRAYKYEDPLEGFKRLMVFNTAKGQSSIDNENKYKIKRKCIMCNCWHKNDNESMAMWEKYHPRNSAIAIKTTMEKLKESLTDTIDVYIGDIEYMSHESIKGGAIIPIQKGNDSNSFQFENLVSLSSASLCYPYFFKRKAFEYEHEVRIIIDIESIMGDVFEKLKDEDFSNPDIIASEFPDINDQGRAYNVDVNTLVEEVIISPYAEPWIENTVQAKHSDVSW